MEHYIPRDTRICQGMKTVMADHREHFAVHYLADLEYAVRDGIPLHYQLLLPNEPQRGVAPGGRDMLRRYPLVVYVQGSGWGIQDRYGNIPQLSEIARRGYVVASVEHRPAGQATFHEILEDVKLAIRYLRAHAQEYDIDPKKAAIWGDSSGGHGSVMTALTGDFPAYKTGGYEEYSDAVSAVIDFYGPTDVSRINEAPRREEVKKQNITNLTTDTPGNPLDYVSSKVELPAFLIMHGDLDSTVPFQQSVLLYEKLLSCGQMAEFYKVIGASHGTGFWTREVLTIVGNFLDGILD